MPLISCKIGIKLTWTKYCVSFANGADNTDANPDNIILTIKDTKLYVPGVTSSAKDNQKLSNFSTMDLKDQFIGINIK